MATNIGSLINGLFSFIMVITSIVFSAGLTLGILCGLISMIISLFLDEERKERAVNFGKKSFSIAFKSFLGLIAMAIIYAVLLVILNFIGFGSVELSHI